MVSSLSSRLQAVLSPDYEVERELGAGGMGTVFLARDLTLDRRVAVKVLRPEFATATATERFLHEARILAKLSHPNIVPVHKAAEAEGIFYYVMDYIEGEALSERLRRGPLTLGEVQRLGRDLLAALEAAHRRGVIHRDVKPGNIFLQDGRAVLGDFGIAKPVESTGPPLTEPGEVLGTPAYMPPEQQQGDITTATDIYAAGMVLYEALSGRRWKVLTSPRQGDWSRVPGHWKRVLCRALALSPKDRWPDAQSFQHALSEDPRRRKLAWAVGVAAVLGIIAVILWPDDGTRDGPPGVSDMAVLPFAIMGQWQEGIDSRDVARAVADHLRLLPPPFRLVPTSRSFAWWDSASSSGDPALDQAARQLNARFAVHGRLFPSSTGLDLEIEIYDAGGQLLADSRQRLSLGRANLLELSDSVTRRLTLVALKEDLRGLPLTANLPALLDYLYGERAFARGDGPTAVSHYEKAVERDSSFMLAWWRLANAWRWVGEPHPYPADFQSLYQRFGTRLPTLDSLLMAAQLAPAGPERLEIYQEAHRRYPRDDFAAYLYGEELFNRGPLWGVGLDSAFAVLEEAVALNPSWGPSYVHLIWAGIRLGRGAETEDYLKRFLGFSGPQNYGGLDPSQLSLAYAARFQTEAARQQFQRLISDTLYGTPHDLAKLVRLAPAFDLPEVQATLGRSLLNVAARRQPLRAAAYQALGRAMMSLGRGAEAFAYFDSAAASVASREARLQRGQWRLLPAALGLPAADTIELREGRELVAALVGDDSLGARAAWTLSLEAYARGDTAAGRAWAVWLRRPSSRPGALLLRRLLEAAELAARGRYRQALDRTEPVLGVQAYTVPLNGGQAAGSLGDPFARAVLHLLRGEWLNRLQEGEAAEREWLWYEGVDLRGLPDVQSPQPGEIDWTFGTYGRYLRGRSELARGDAAAACRHLSEATVSWAGATSAIAELADSARRLSEQACPQKARN